jgi:antirestriction protein ArdC
LQAPAYFNTVFHEVSHWSEHRLNWLADPHLPTKERYRIGELRATLGASFLCSEIGIPFYHGKTSHRMFVGTWLELMRADPTLIFRVSEAASEAAKFILSFKRNQEAA